MGWLLDHFGLFIVLIVGISILRGIARILRAGSDDTARQPTGEDSAAAERTRRVQEEIRRKIAERRSGVTRKVAERIPSLVRPLRVPPLDPFGGPMRRVGRKIEEMAEPWLRPADEAATQAVLDRAHGKVTQGMNLKTPEGGLIVKIVRFKQEGKHAE